MSKDKYMSIFLPQMETIVFVILQIFYATRAVLKIGVYSRSCDVFTPIVHEQKDLIDYNWQYYFNVWFLLLLQIQQEKILGNTGCKAKWKKRISQKENKQKKINCNENLVVAVCDSILTLLKCNTMRLFIYSFTISQRLKRSCLFIEGSFVYGSWHVISMLMVEVHVQSLLNLLMMNKV